MALQQINENDTGQVVAQKILGNDQQLENLIGGFNAAIAQLQDNRKLLPVSQVRPNTYLNLNGEEVGLNGFTTKYFTYAAGTGDIYVTFRNPGTTVATLYAYFMTAGKVVLGRSQSFAPGQTVVSALVTGIPAGTALIGLDSDASYDQSVAATAFNYAPASSVAVLLAKTVERIATLTAFTIPTVETDGFINGSGAFQPFGGWNSSDFAEVYENDVVIHTGVQTGGDARAVVLYNSAKALHSVLLEQTDNPAPKRFVIPALPAGRKYVRMCGNDGVTFGLEKFILRANNFDSTALLALIGETYLKKSDAPQLSVSGSVNALNPAGAVNTRAVNKNGDEFNILEIPSSLGFILSAPIAVLPGEWYAFSGFTGDKQFQCQGANGAQLANAKGFRVGPNESRQMPAGCYFIQGNLKTDTDSAAFPQFQIQRGQTVTPFEPYAENITKGLPGTYLESNRLSAGTKMTRGGVLQDVATVEQIVGPVEPIASTFTKVLAVGTSITNDVGASAPANGFRTVLADILTNVLGRTITVINGGVSGQDSNGMNGNIDGLLNTNSPQVVLIEVAINDARLDNLQPIGTTLANLRQMVDKVRAKGAVPIIWGCYPLGMTSWGSLAARSRIVAAGRMVASEKKCQFIDFEFGMADRTELLADGIHPNDAGHRLGAGLLSRAFF